MTAAVETVRSKQPVFWGRKRTREAFTKAIVLIIILIGAIPMILPFLWMISASMKGMGEFLTEPPIHWIPLHPKPENYIELFKVPHLPMGRFFLNSTFVSIFAVVGATLSSAFVGFGFARLRFPGRDILFLVLLSTVMLPGVVTMIPSFQIFKWLGWVNTYRPLIVPAFLGSPFFIFLMRQFFMTIPHDLDDAARLDGCGWFSIWWRIALPLCRPAMATIAIFSFMGSWNSFMGPLIYLNDIKKYTIPLGLATFLMGSHMEESRQDLRMAGAILAIVPCLILFFSAQRYFIQGIVITGVEK